MLIKQSMSSKLASQKLLFLNVTRIFQQVQSTKVSMCRKWHCKNHKQVFFHGKRSLFFNNKRILNSIFFIS